MSNIKKSSGTTSRVGLPSSTPQSVEGIAKTKFDIVEAELSGEELEFFGDQLGNIFDCMNEWAKIAVGDKEREIEEWKHAADSFELTAKEFKKEIQFLNDRNEYWKARCEAAEDVIGVERTRASAERLGDRSGIEAAYGKWQALKQPPIK